MQNNITMDYDFQLLVQSLKYGDTYQAQLLCKKIMSVDINFMNGHVRFISKLLSSNSQSKHAYRWIISTSKDYVLEKAIPWIAFDAIDFLYTYISTILAPQPKVFEYGSGGSTLFFIRNNSDITSVEHNITWYNDLSKRLYKLHSVRYLYVPPKPANFTYFDPSSPNLYQSASPEFREYEFSDYVKTIDEFPDSYFDIISIDGRARSSCIVHAGNKLKSGGIIMLDNSDRDYYTKSIWQYLSNFNQIDFYGAFPVIDYYAMTSVYMK